MRAGWPLLREGGSVVAAREWQGGRERRDLSMQRLSGRRAGDSKRILEDQTLSITFTLTLGFNTVAADGFLFPAFDASLTTGCIVLKHLVNGCFGSVEHNSSPQLNVLRHPVLVRFLGTFWVTALFAVSS